MTDRIVVFAREPLPGLVKTRLARSIGAVGAASVYGALLAHTLAEATATGVRVRLALAAAPTREWRPPIPVDTALQAPGDLGERMAAAFAAEFAAGALRVVLIGSDAPGIRSGLISAAFTALDRVPVVLGPALDGGYWLVGQRAPGVAMFTDVPWSEPETLAATRDRLRVLGVVHDEIATLRDIDTAEDLAAAVRDAGASRSLRAQLRAALAGRQEG